MVWCGGRGRTSVGCVGSVCKCGCMYVCGVGGGEEEGLPRLSKGIGSLTKAMSMSK